MEQHPAHQHAAEGRAEPPPRGFGAHGRAWVPLALALLLTLLNAPKPLHVDDGFFWQYARQIAVAPSDPYGFLSFLDERPEPANQMLAPPVLPYWWAIGMRLFGERPLLWKLWLFPIVWLFTHSLHALLQRFAAGLEQPLLVLAVLSPVVLPALNLMLDIPALALSLCAFRLYLLASDTLERGPAAAYRLAFAAGVVAAFAIQTKYTALLLPAVLLGHALLFGRLRLWALLAGVAAALFVAWESFVAARYGQSHFVYHYYANHSVWTEKLAFATPLFPLLGALGPGLLLLGLVALRRARAAALAAVSVGAVFLAVALVPEAAATFAPGAPPNREPLTLGFLLFAALGTATLLTVGAGAARLLRGADRLDVFLVYWLGLELAGYFAMSPFPAARRVLGLFVASVVVLGRLAARTLPGPERRRLQLPLLVNALVGTLFFAIDFHEAWQTRRIVERAADWIRPRSAPGSRTFYVGHWGFQYYAERAGMIAAVDRQFYRRTILRRGDFLVVPGPRISQQRFWIDPARSEPAQLLRSVDALPLRTLHCYYQGRTPLERHDGPRMEVTIYKVTDEFPVRPFRGHAEPRS